MTKIKTGKRSVPLGGRIFTAVAYLYLILFAITVLIPFFVVLITSVTKQSELIATMDFIWFPKEGLTAEGYYTALFSDILDAYGISVLRGFFNTLWQTLLTLLVGLFVSGLSAFAFAKLRFPGKRVLFYILIGTMMIPGAVMTMPSYIFYDAIGWSNSVLPIVIPGMFGGAMTVFFLRQFFMTIPTELLEAAKIDGLGFFGMYVRIMIPLAKPAFLAQFIFGFVGGYNNYLAPLLYLNGQTELYPLQMVITLFNSIYSGNLTAICAFIVIGLAPLLIIYSFSQKYFIQGIAAEGIKG